MLGIMLARPVASIVADRMSWHAIFALSAGILLAALAMLTRTLPRRVLIATLSYGELLPPWRASLSKRRSCGVALFIMRPCLPPSSLFWTAMPLLLSGPDYRLVADRHCLVRSRGRGWRHCQHRSREALRIAAGRAPQPEWHWCWRRFAFPL